jgi:hypothetical protein
MNIIDAIFFIPAMMFNEVNPDCKIFSSIQFPRFFTLGRQFISGRLPSVVKCRILGVEGFQ